MRVTITAQDAETARFEGTVIVLTGTADDGSRVTFAGDRRPMNELGDAVLADGEATAEVESWQVLSTVPLRKAVVPVTGIHADEKAVAAYLPSNYRVTGTSKNELGGTNVHIEGHDVAGWTLEEYVIPRLASDLIFASEVTE
jgi:hypothetical protein